MFSLRFDDEVVKTYIKVDEETGYLMAMSDNQPVVGDFQLAVFDVDYNSEMILYQCLPIKGSFSRLGIIEMDSLTKLMILTC